MTEPEFFKYLDELLKTVALDDWTTCLRWHVVHTNATLLPARFVNENFAFFQTTLAGAKELAPRWKGCVRYNEHDLGEALGQKYVELTFGTEGMIQLGDRSQQRGGQQLILRWKNRP